MPSRLVSSSVGTKVLIAVTGLCLFLFLIVHLTGNLLIFVGPATFNGYSHKLISNPLIYGAEIGLLLLFLIHVYKTVVNWFGNRGARPVAYEKKEYAGGPSRKSPASSTMIYTGVLTFVFVALHLKTFKYGPWYEVQEAGGTGPAIRDLYKLTFEVFSNPLVVAFYVVCMGLLGFHLWHGFASATQSLGLDHPRRTPAILKFSKLAAVVIGGGFLLIPVVIYFWGDALMQRQLSTGAAHAMSTLINLLGGRS